MPNFDYSKSNLIATITLTNRIFPITFSAISFNEYFTELNIDKLGTVIEMTLSDVAGAPSDAMVLTISGLTVPREEWQLGFTNDNRLLVNTDFVWSGGIATGVSGIVYNNILSDKRFYITFAYGNNVDGTPMLVTIFSATDDFSTLIGARPFPTYSGGLDYDYITEFTNLIKVNSVNSVIVDPSEQFFYKEANQPSSFLWRDWCNIYLEFLDGHRRLANINEFTYSISSSEITDFTISPYDGMNYKFQIEYTRPNILNIDNFTVTIQFVDDPNLVATIRYVGINSISNIYTPSIGPGTGGTGGFPSSIGGGGGNFGVVNGTPEASDPIAPSLPPTGSFEGSVANAGLFVHYAMNANMLEVVGDWLWATDLGLIIAKEVLSILYGSPIESAISLMSYPFNVTALPGVVSNQQELYWGAHGAGFNATAITNPYATIDWGTVQLTEFWGNFLDYAPHTKLELYLPWCTGFVPIDPNECLPGSLRVVTNIELAKGTCLHNVIGNDGRVIATHSGTCGKQLPLTALDTSGKALQLVSTASGALIAGVSALAARDAGSNAAQGYHENMYAKGLTPEGFQRRLDKVVERAEAPHRAVARRAENRALIGSVAASRTPVSVQRSGSFSGSSAGLGVQYPYLILSRPTQSVPAQYGHHYGYPSNIYTPLTNLRGYTEVGEIHLTGFVCTEDELTEIDSLLKGGVIL